MDDLGFIVGGYALVLGTMLAYAAFTIWRHRSLTSELPADTVLPPLPYTAPDGPPNPDHAD